MVFYQLIFHLANKILVLHVSDTFHAPVNGPHVCRYSQWELDTVTYQQNKTKSKTDKQA